MKTKIDKRIEKLYFENVQPGDMRIWWIPQLPMDSFVYPVKSIAEAKHMLEMLAFYDMFQFEHNVKPDYCNVGGLQIWEDVDGEGNFDWLDWFNELGYGINDVDEDGNRKE